MWARCQATSTWRAKAFQWFRFGRICRAHCDKLCQRWRQHFPPQQFGRKPGGGNRRARRSDSRIQRRHGRHLVFRSFNGQVVCGDELVANHLDSRCRPGRALPLSDADPSETVLVIDRIAGSPQDQFESLRFQVAGILSGGAGFNRGLLTQSGVLEKARRGFEWTVYAWVDASCRCSPGC